MVERTAAPPNQDAQPAQSEQAVGSPAVVYQTRQHEGKEEE